MARAGINIHGLVGKAASVPAPVFAFLRSDWGALAVALSSRLRFRAVHGDSPVDAEVARVRPDREGANVGARFPCGTQRIGPFRGQGDAGARGGAALAQTEIARARSGLVGGNKLRIGEDVAVSPAGP